MVEWLEQASQWHEIDCCDPYVMSSNPGWDELGVRSRPTSVLVVLEQKKYFLSIWLKGDVMSKLNGSSN